RPTRASTPSLRVALPISRELRTGHGKAQIRKSRQHEAHPCGSTIYGGDDRFRQAEMIGEGRIELGRHAEARPCDVIRGAGIIATLFGMAFKCRHIGTRAKGTAFGIARDDEDTDGRVLVCFREHKAVLSMHPPRPGVAALRARKRDCGDTIRQFVADRLQFHDVALPFRRSYLRSEPPVAFSTAAMIAFDTASISSSVSVFSTG